MSNHEIDFNDYDATTRYPDVNAYILYLIRENKKLEKKLGEIERIATDKNVIGYLTIQGAYSLRSEALEKIREVLS